MCQYAQLFRHSSVHMPETEIDRQTDTQTDRQTDNTDRQTDGHTDGQTNRRTDRQTDRQTDTQTDRQTDKTDRQTDGQTDTQTDRQTDKTDRQTDGHTDGQTHRQTDRQTVYNVRAYNVLYNKHKCKHYEEFCTYLCHSISDGWISRVAYKRFPLHKLEALKTAPPSAVAPTWHTLNTGVGRTTVRPSPSIHQSIFISQKRQTRHMQHTLVKSKSE